MNRLETPFSSVPTSSVNEPLSVTALSQALKNHVESRFSHVKIRGEVTGAKLHSSGHLYFTLKDAQSTIAAVSWRGVVARFPIRVQDGLDIICQGRLTTYPLQSKYQLVVESVELAGQGSLLKMLEELRRKLEAEGLFRPERKKPLPFLPSLIGIITSPTGAVIQDMLHRLRDRCPTRLLLWPVLVQGADAGRQIVEAIEGFNQLDTTGPIPRPDLIIVARGGGSLEDLWPFNEEAVVRAVAASHIPIISGVGHEPDVTLIDYVADHRSPTPTATIEQAVPVRAALIDALNAIDKRLYMQVTRRWEELTQRLDNITRHLNKTIEASFIHHQGRLKSLERGLKHPKDFLNLVDVRLKNVFDTLRKSFDREFERKATRLQRAGALLESYSCQKTLKRGFAIVFDAGGHVVLSSKSLEKDQKLSLKWHDGETTIVVK